MNATVLRVTCLIASAYLVSQVLSPSNVQEQEACNKAINWTYLYHQFIDRPMEASNSFLVIRHSQLFVLADQDATSNLPTTEESSRQQNDAALTIDLDDLLRRIWNLETNNMRVLYPDPIHSIKYPILKAQVTAAMGLDARSCVPGEDQHTILISEVLLRKLWEESLRSAVATEYTFDKDLNTPAKLLDAVATLRAINLTTNDILHDSDADANDARLLQLATNAYRISEIANQTYNRAILFILAHESAHVWFDQCEGTPQETRADDYGLLLSTTWAGEQFQHFVLASERNRAIDKYIAENKKQRMNARRLLKRVPKDASEFDEERLKETAALTDAQIAGMASDEYPEQDVLDFAHPFGEAGYEIFNTVYKNADLTGDDDTHLSLADREARLEKGYGDETLHGEEILLRLYKNRDRLKLMVESTQRIAGDDFVMSIFAIDEVERRRHPECEIRP
jgi:hypothetical protein